MERSAATLRVSNREAAGEATMIRVNPDNALSPGRQFNVVGRTWDRDGRHGLTLLHLDFLGHGRDGIAGLVDGGLQHVCGDAEPSGPDPNLSRILQVDLVPNRWMFEALHALNFPRWRVNTIATASFR
jgi:hypothetical protein